MPYIRLSQLDRKTFTVKKYLGRHWQKYNEAEKRYEKSDSPQQGFSERFKFETDKGELEVSRANVGDMCAAVLNQEGQANLLEKTFSVKTNGKEGKEIRYWLNLVRQSEMQKIIAQQEEPFIP